MILDKWDSAKTTVPFFARSPGAWWSTSKKEVLEQHVLGVLVHDMPNRNDFFTVNPTVRGDANLNIEGIRRVLVDLYPVLLLIVLLLLLEAWCLRCLLGLAWHIFYSLFERFRRVSRSCASGKAREQRPTTDTVGQCFPGTAANFQVNRTWPLWFVAACGWHAISFLSLMVIGSGLEWGGRAVLSRLF